MSAQDRPRIAVDLDGVVYDWTGTVKYLVRKHHGVMLGEWTDWDYGERNMPPEVWRWLWTDGIDLGLFRYGHHLKGSVDGLRALAEVGDLEVVTHRPRAGLQDTLRFIANLPDVFSGVHFLTHAEPKSIIGCDVYLDDASHVAQDVTDAGFLAVVFDQPWNRHVRMVRANGWDDVVPAVRAALELKEDQ
jgi:hypothetical protein